MNINYSYLMGANDVSKLEDKGFMVQKINENYGIKFTKEQEKEYEKFIISNLKTGYWNEYLGDETIFIFKFNDNTIKKYIYDTSNEEEILNLCSEFAGCKFPSIMQMLKDNIFYAENYFNNN